MRNYKPYLRAAARAYAESSGSRSVIGRYVAARRLLRDREGATLVEWALVSPVLVLTIMVFIELTMMLFINILVEGGMREAARYGITGQVPVGITRQEQILQIVKDNTLGFLDNAGTTVTFLVYGTFQQVGQGEPFVDANSNGKWDTGEDYTDQNGNGQYDTDLGVPGLGGSGEIVSYRVEYNWTLLTPFLAPLTRNGDGKLKFASSIVVRNEPFPVTP